MKVPTPNQGDAMASVCVDGFVEALLQNRLLEPEHHAEVFALQIRLSDPRLLAQELIRRGWLTPYQVNQLFLGRGSTLVLGPYVLLERLGEGGMGQVFKASQGKLKRIVALKIIRKDFMNHPRAVPRFLREIQAAAQLSHPNIVRALDAGEVAGTYYFAMEFVNGIDLDRLVKQSGPLRVDQACDFIAQAALGLQHAHEHGLVHRDIKPANLFVSRSSSENSEPQRSRSGLLTRPGSGSAPWGIVKILDLGLARWEDPLDDQPHQLTQLGSLMGTPDFISPEQARNSRTCDIRADLYSLGCTFYFLLTGNPPFPKGSLTEKLYQHHFGEAIPVAEARRQKLMEDLPSGGEDRAQKLIAVPEEVASAVHTLMAKKPEDRYQTPAELAGTLRSVQQAVLSKTR
jgi:serine/threonine-protein kinase